MRSVILVLLVALPHSSCSKRDRTEPAAPIPADTASVTVHLDAVTPSTHAAPARGGPDDPLAEKLRHCPTTVEGAQVTIRDVAGGIELDITATDPAATTEIRRRATHLVELTRGRSGRGEHGGGGGGGTMRNCPVVISTTAIDADETPGGSRITVTPTAGYTVDALRAETRRRHDALTKP